MRSYLTLLSHPILTTPDFNKEFQIFTDASDVGLGVILHQGDSIITCASRILKPAEKNYSVIEKECLALVYAVKQFGDLQIDMDSHRSLGTSS
jgi:hypothetical protein